MKVLFQATKQQQSKLLISNNKTPSLYELTNSVSIITQSPLFINNPYYYNSVSLTISQLLAPEMLQIFQKETCSTYAISNYHHLTICDSVLKFRVTKDIYSSLGLIGTKFNHFYVITVDLSDINFKPGSKNYDRCKWSFTNLTTKFDMLISHFDNLTGCIPTELHNSIKISPELISTSINVPIPTFDFFSNSHNLEQFEQISLEWLEWIGMALINSDRLKLDDKVDKFISMYEIPLPNMRSDIHITKITGLLHPSFLAQIFSILS
jgi:hypothetical protein